MTDDEREQRIELVRGLEWAINSMAAHGFLSAIAEEQDPPPVVFRSVRKAVPSCPAVDRLARAVLGHVRRVLDYVGLDSPDEMTDGMLCWDARFAAYLEGLGAVHRAGKVRTKARERAAALDHPVLPGFPPLNYASLYALWTYGGKDAPPPVVLVHLAAAVWETEVRDQVDRLDRLRTAVVPLPLHRRIGGVFTREGAARILVPVANVDLLTLPGLDALGTLTCQRLVRWLAQEQFDREVRGDTRPIVIEGGYTALARLIGAGASKVIPGQLKVILETFHATTIPWEGKGASSSTVVLPHLQEERQRPGRPARLVLGTGSPLLSPGLIFELPKGHPARALVPVVPLPPLDTLNPKYQPAAARLDWLGWRALRELAVDLVTRGTVDMPWPDLATEAGLPATQLEGVLDAWVAAGRWQRIGDRWRPLPVPETRAALAYLEEGGKMSQDGSDQGKASADKRTRARTAR